MSPELPPEFSKVSPELELGIASPELLVLLVPILDCRLPEDDRDCNGCILKDSGDAMLICQDRISELSIVSPELSVPL